MRRLYLLFLLLSRVKQIATVVCMGHLIALLFLTCHHLISGTLKPPRPMIVKTITPQRAVEIKTEEKEIPKQVASFPKPKPTPAKKSVVKKKPLAAKQPSSQSARAPIQKSELNKLVESFDALSTENRKTDRPSLNIPSKVVPKNFAKEENSRSEDTNYSEYLIAFLQNVLDLPEYGEVKIEIEIDSFGKPVNCRILESKSVKNANFLQEELSLLTFPIPHLDPFENTKTFSVTFKNR